jgi:hypothetical protein
VISGLVLVHDDLDRFLALVCRELGAEAARVLEADAEAPDGELTLIGRMGDGRAVVATFAEAPVDREAKQRRLEMLTSTLDAAADEPPPSRRSRPPVETSLHDELSDLCARAAALNAIIIDANSPVVWGAAHPEGVVAQPPLASSPRMTETPANDEGERGGGMAVASRRAVLAARALPELAALRKGKHLRSVARDAEVPFVAHSFASIYLLVVVYDQPFDELRAERAIVDSLPRIERLVLALPPLEPPPPFIGAGAVALRRPRRR